MSDYCLEDYIHSEIIVDNFNNALNSVVYLKNDLVKLGEDSKYISNLCLNYACKYLVSSSGFTGTERFMAYRKNFMDHLFEITKAKYPSKYECLLDKYDWKV